MADSKVFLAKGAVLLCEKSKASTVKLVSEDRGFSFNGVYFATNQDKIGVKHIPLFAHCQWNEDNLGQDICTVGAVRWYLTKDDTYLGEELELLTLDSFAVCGQALAKIKPVSDAQGVITIEEGEWVKLIKEKLQELLDEYEKALEGKTAESEKIPIRAEFRRKYMDMLRLALQADYPGKYDEIMKGIDRICEDALKDGSLRFDELNDKRKKTSLTESEQKKYDELYKKMLPKQEKFRELMSTLAVLFEKYTDIPAEVMAGMSFVESNSGVSRLATGSNQDGEINNLWGALITVNYVDANGDTKSRLEAINYSSREIGTAAYLLTLQTDPIYDGLFECNTYEEWFAFLEGKYEQHNSNYTEEMIKYVNENVIDLVNSLKEKY